MRKISRAIFTSRTRISALQNASRSTEIPASIFCPAAVYEMAKEANGSLKLKISAANCVHCKTCDIADPISNY